MQMLHDVVQLSYCSLIENQCNTPYKLHFQGNAFNNCSKTIITVSMGPWGK